jgi:hypothetical protein
MVVRKYQLRQGGAEENRGASRVTFSRAEFRPHRVVRNDGLPVIQTLAAKPV